MQLQAIFWHFTKFISSRVWRQPIRTWEFIDSQLWLADNLVGCLRYDIFDVWWMDLDSWDFSAIFALECNILCSEIMTSKWPKTYLCYILLDIILFAICLKLTFCQFSRESHTFLILDLYYPYILVIQGRWFSQPLASTLEKSYTNIITLENHTLAEIYFVSPSQQVTFNHFRLI